MESEPKFQSPENKPKRRKREPMMDFLKWPAEPAPKSPRWIELKLPHGILLRIPADVAD
jgi:hypothetical protein